MIPDWMPLEAWSAYMDMRKAMGKKYVATEYAQKLLIAKLGKWRAEGQDIEEIINQSIERSWTGLFPIKDLKTRNWWETDAGIIAKGREFGLAPRNGETMYQFKDRINKVIASGGIERRAEARTYQHEIVETAEPDRSLARMQLQTALEASRKRVKH